MHVSGRRETGKWRGRGRGGEDKKHLREVSGSCNDVEAPVIGNSSSAPATRKIPVYGGPLILDIPRTLYHAGWVHFFFPAGRATEITETRVRTFPKEDMESRVGEQQR